MIDNYLTQLENDKSDLVDNLTTKGITGLTGNETFTQLVPEVLNIPTGTIPSGILSITENNIYDVTNYASANVNVSTEIVEEKDVNFYDYDGTVLYAYTKSDFLGLSSLPNNPSHTGLTAQGWNWTLSDAQNYVQEYDKLNIGQMYITDDGATRIYFTLSDGRLSPYFGICVNGSVTVDWGDNTTSTITGSSITTRINTQHTYDNPGDYVISITADTSETLYSFLGYAGYGGTILWANILNSNSINRTYQNCITKIELGSNITTIGQYAFGDCNGVRYITIPNEVTTIGDGLFNVCRGLKYITLPSQVSYFGTQMFRLCFALACVSLPKNIFTSYSGDNWFYQCYALSHITLPRGLTSIPTSSFRDCSSMKSITMPNTITTTYDSAFSACYALIYAPLPSSLTNMVSASFSNNHSLTRVEIPSGVTTFGTNAFNSCYSVRYYDFSNHTSIPTMYGNTFSNLPSDCKIIVPDDLYNTWLTTSNWSNYSSYIIKKSDWDAL